MKRSKKNSQRLVIKVGSSILTGGRQSIIKENLRRVVRHVMHFVGQGNDVILVSSGAIASGLSVLGFRKRPKSISELQAAAATGQNILIQNYSAAFEKEGRKCAQILLTREDLGRNRERHIKAKDTIQTLLEFNIIPIVNENDAVSVDEIKFGDNDVLSALVAAAVEADGLLLLTDIDALYENYNPKSKAPGTPIKEVDEITPQIEKFACGTDKVSCVGGMSSKIEAARIATNMGIPVILANGLKDTLNIDFTTKSYEDFDGTKFKAAKTMGARRHWIAFSAMAKGKIVVDEGAKHALIFNNRSLLSPGVMKLDGIFETGDIVEIVDSQGNTFAKGKVRCSSSQLQEIKGKRNKGEVIHRDNLVILG